MLCLLQQVCKALQKVRTLSIGTKWASLETAPEQEQVMSRPPGCTSRIACIAALVSTCHACIEGVTSA